MIQLYLFCLLNLFQEVPYLIVSTLAIGDERTSCVITLNLSIICFAIVWLYCHSSDPSKRTFWHCAIKIERAKESFLFKLLTTLVMTIILSNALNLWVTKRYYSNDPMIISSVGTEWSVASALFLNLREFYLIWTYDGAYHKNLDRNVILAKVTPKKFIGPILHFWSDSGAFLRDLREISMIKKAHIDIPVKRLREMEEYRDLPWQLVDCLEERDIHVLAHAINTRRKKNSFVRALWERIKRLFFSGQAQPTYVRAHAYSSSR